MDPANNVFTNINLMTDKHNIPKGSKMHSNCRLLPDHIVHQRRERENSYSFITEQLNLLCSLDPSLKLRNEEITSDIQKHKQNIWKEHLDAHWDHRHNTHNLWKTIHGISNRATQHPKTLKHATHKTNRHINRATHNIRGHNITLTTSQVQEAIKQSKNNNSQGSDKLNIRHLKHIPLLHSSRVCLKLFLTKT